MFLLLNGLLSGTAQSQSISPDATSIAEANAKMIGGRNAQVIHGTPAIWDPRSPWQSWMSHIHSAQAIITGFKAEEVHGGARLGWN